MIDVRLFLLGPILLLWAGLAAADPARDLLQRMDRAVGSLNYQGTFVQEWVGKLIYYDAPLWVFATIYSLFGALVLASWIWVRPGKI